MHCLPPDWPPPQCRAAAVFRGSGSPSADEDIGGTWPANSQQAPLSVYQASLPVPWQLGHYHILPSVLWCRRRACLGGPTGRPTSYPWDTLSAMPRTLFWMQFSVFMKASVDVFIALDAQRKGDEFSVAQQPILSVCFRMEDSEVHFPREFHHLALAFFPTIEE